MSRPPIKLLASAAALGLCLCNCARDGTPADPAASAATPRGEAADQAGDQAGEERAEPDVTELNDRSLLSGAALDNIDSLALWTGTLDTGEPGELLLATAKETHRLWVLDLAGGSEPRTVGGPGDGPGEFQRPNGVAVEGHRAFVVERDNHRLQVLELPALSPLGTFGEEQLRRPYGLAVRTLPDERLEVWVTDNYIETDEIETDESIPPASELGARLHRFVLDDDLSVTEHATFGPTDPGRALHKVESLAIDEERQRLLVAEEDEARMSLAVFDLDGNWQRVAGRDWLLYEPEGLDLWHCSDQGLGEQDFWIVTDQGDQATLFHVLDADSLEPVARFRGALTANTDGITLSSAPLGAFPGGAVFAVHDDRGVTVFEGRDLLAALPALCDSP